VCAQWESEAGAPKVPPPAAAAASPRGSVPGRPARGDRWSCPWGQSRAPPVWEGATRGDQGRFDECPMGNDVRAATVARSFATKINKTPSA